MIDMRKMPKIDMRKMPRIPKVQLNALTKTQMIAFAVIGVAIVAGTLITVMVFNAPSAAPKAAEEQAADLLTNELGSIDNLNIDEMENMLKLMIS